MKRGAETASTCWPTGHRVMASEIGISSIMTVEPRGRPETRTLPLSAGTRAGGRVAGGGEDGGGAAGVDATVDVVSWLRSAGGGIGSTGVEAAGEGGERIAELLVAEATGVHAAEETVLGVEGLRIGDFGLRIG